MPLGLPDLGEFPKHQPRCHFWLSFQQEDIHTRACRRTQSVFSSGFRPCVSWSDKVDEAFVAVHSGSSVAFEMAPVSDNLADERPARGTLLTANPTAFRREPGCGLRCTCGLPSVYLLFSDSPLFDALC